MFGLVIRSPQFMIHCTSIRIQSNRSSNNRDLWHLHFHESYSLRGFGLLLKLECLLCTTQHFSPRSNIFSPLLILLGKQVYLKSNSTFPISALHCIELLLTNNSRATQLYTKNLVVSMIWGITGGKESSPKTKSNTFELDFVCLPLC